MASSVGWHFPPTGGGKEDGYNDSGVAHFSGTPLYSLARETIQNSLDARKLEGEPVEVEFELIAVEPEEIGSTELTSAIRSSIGRAEELPDRDAERALRKALGVLNSDPIHCLRVSDLNTTGLREGKWRALVKMQGFSQKDDAGAGGSHGIGKYAPFAVSALRTVFYWTCYEEDDERAEKLQGKAVLMSHGTTTRRTQGTGFYGVKEECEALSNADSIPASLRRLNANRLPEHGTALVIAGFSEESNWQQRIASSVIENYFYAIAQGSLKVLVDPGVHATNLPDVQIDNTNLSQWFETLEDSIASDDDEDGSALRRAKAYCELVNGSIVPTEKQDNELGHCKLYVRVGEGLPSRVALVRRTGMLVTDQQTNLLRFPLHREFAAMCIFEDPSGNELLRRMENPQHDRFEHNRLPEEERGKGKRALKRITSWIRDEIRKQAGPQETSQTTILSELSAYLPDLHLDEPFDGADEGNEGTKERGFGERITMSLKPIRKSAPALPKGDEDDAEGTGSDLGNSGGGGTDTNGGGSGSGGPGEGEGDGGSGSRSGGAARRPLPISAVRVLPVREGENLYCLSFRPHRSGTCRLEVEEAGDSSTSTLEDVRAADGTPLANVSVTLMADERTSLEILSDSPIRDRAIRVVAVEVANE